MSREDEAKKKNRENQRRYIEANPEKIAERARRYREANREKLREKSRRYREEHPEKMAEARRRWSEQNPKTPEKRREWDRRWKELNPEKVTKARRRWSKLHPEKAVFASRRRRAIKAGINGSHTEAEWQALCDRYGNKCLACGEVPDVLTCDHVVPISMGGSDDISNIQPLCGTCNSRKYTKTTDYRLVEKVLSE